MPVGRPSKFTPKLAEEICERIASGETLVSICRDDHMPHIATVLKWPDEQFRQMYARAKELRLEVMAEEIRQIADTPQVGEKVKEGPSGTETITGDMVEHRKLQVDTRKWLLARLAAKTFGDRISQQLSGPDGGPIQSKLTIEVVDYANDSDKPKDDADPS